MPAVSAAAAPAASVPTVGGMPQNLTPEQVEAFRQQMRDRFGKRGGDANDPRQRGADVTTNGKTPKTPVAAPTTTKTPKTPKVR